MLIGGITPSITPWFRATRFRVAAPKSSLTESSAIPDAHLLSPAISTPSPRGYRFIEIRGMEFATSSRRAALASGGFIVKTRIQSLSFLATLAIALLCWGSALNAQNTPSTTPDRQAQQPSSSPDTTPPQSTPETQSPSSQTPSQTPDTQQTPDQTPPPSSRTPESGSQQPPSGSSADSGAAAGTQTFSGTVTKQGDKYVLKDDSGKTYDIDHQDEVKKFEGKRVRVQGTLDPATNKIMVK